MSLLPQKNLVTSNQLDEGCFCLFVYYCTSGWFRLYIGYWIAPKEDPPKLSIWGFQCLIGILRESTKKYIQNLMDTLLDIIKINLKIVKPQYHKVAA